MNHEKLTTVSDYCAALNELSVQLIKIYMDFNKFTINQIQDEIVSISRSIAKLQNEIVEELHKPEPKE